MADPEQLRTAVERLENAAGHADDPAANRLAAFADQLRGFLAEGRTPDHGRLARILHVLDDLEGEVSTEALEAIDRAREALLTYREGVEGI